MQNGMKGMPVKGMAGTGMGKYIPGITWSSAWLENVGREETENTV